MSHNITIGGLFAALGLIAGVALAAFGALALFAAGMSDSESAGAASTRTGCICGAIGVALTLFSLWRLF